MILWLRVTQDEYELPMVVADSRTELAEMLGVRPKNISSTMAHAKRRGWRCCYQKVEVDDD